MTETRKCTCTGTGLNACASCPTPWPDIGGATRIRADDEPVDTSPARSELLILPWKCPFCVGGLGPSLNGGAERCMHCAGVGLTDDPCGEAERAPRPPGVMRAPCADCAFRRGSPELENQGVQLPDDEPFFCHQGLPISALGAYTPVATFRGLPLGAMVCAGWWALHTGEALPGKPYREVPIHEDEVEKRWAPTKPCVAALDGPGPADTHTTQEPTS